MDEYKRDLIEIYTEFTDAVLDGDTPDFDRVITIMEKYGIEVDDELSVVTDEEEEE